jgi:hypothetical protein
MASQRLAQEWSEMLIQKKFKPPEAEIEGA